MRFQFNLLHAMIKTIFQKIIPILLLTYSVMGLGQSSYPNKPIRLLVPYTPGGSTDIFARMLGNKLTEIYKQPVIIENKPGASGQIAMDVMLKAPADGYTIYLGNIGNLAVNVPLFKNLSYDPRKDIAPISKIAQVTNVLVVNSKIPVKTVAELIQYAKARPGTLSYSSGGNGSAAHIAMEYFKLQTGIDVIHIPYKGTSPAVTDVIGGQVDMIMTGSPPLMPFIEAEKVNPIAVSSSKRIDSLPKLPTIAESGIPELKGFEATQWYGVVAKAGTPKEIIAILNKGVQETFGSATAREEVKKSGANVELDSPEEFANFIRSEIDRWSKVVKAAGITPS